MVVGICGSPRKAGNSEFLLNEALAVAGERGFETEEPGCRPPPDPTSAPMRREGRALTGRAGRSAGRKSFRQ